MTAASESLDSAVATLTRYFVANQTLAQSLYQVAELTVDTFPQTTHAGIGLLVNGALTTSAFTHPAVVEIDDVQYRLGQGPSVDANREGRAHVLESTLEPGRCQAFRDVAVRHGVRSALSLPLATNHGAIGTLNMYAETAHAYSPGDLRAAEVFASQAASLLANAQAYWDARTRSENLEQAMLSRATIEQAKGIIMTTAGCGPDEAMRLMLKQSQDQNIKLRLLAAEIVRSATRRT